MSHLQGSDETVTCISTSEFESVQHGFNPAYYNDRHRIVSTSLHRSMGEYQILELREKLTLLDNLRDYLFGLE